MALRCSLLGHDFGEPEVDREREERGSEVVVTVTEFKRCDRCGKRKVTSENTEITSARRNDEPDTPDQSVPAPEESSTPASESSDEVSTATSDAGDGQHPVDLDSGTHVDADPALEGADATIIDGSDDGEPDQRAEPDPGAPSGDAGDGSVRPGADPEAEPSAGQKPDAVETADALEEDGPITDDAEILTDDEMPEGDRGHGEWPETDDVGPPVGADNEPAAWPESEDQADSEDPAPDAERPSASGTEASGVADPADQSEGQTHEADTAEPSAGELTFEEDQGADHGGHERAWEGSESEDHDQDSGPGPGPDHDQVTDDAEFIDGTDEHAEGSRASDDNSTGELDTGIASAGSAPAPGEAGTQQGAFTEFFCPQCSFVAPGDRGSLRAGDICPECRKGYLGERDR